ncbi:hypothetical protein [Streptomyces sp900116325]|uniref:hypothetical protein n=1 Tax=Streptomyces sp. 900116325 TaxID=3154295 RepID=UPI003323956C
MTASSAQASTTLYCDTTGASGAITVNNYYANTTESFGVILSVPDLLGDGHHARIRLIGKGPGGTRVNWPWHYNYDGADTTKAWSSSAQYSAGLADFGLQVARYEGDTYLNSCTKWAASDGS